MPLPPYIAAKRAPDAQDRTDYQTVFARHAGPWRPPPPRCTSTSPC
jgi:S-adenosylmethionine:tRNA ribosyltransferase-isomerase